MPKILALHGVGQSGVMFRRRTATIVDTLSPLGYEFVFITGPCDIAGTAYIHARQEDWKPGDDERSWWETDEVGQRHVGIEAAMEIWGKALKEHGPFVGALGFSQGGCSAASLAAMLEPSRRSHPLTQKYLPSWHPPLEFLVTFSANPYRFPTPLVYWLFYPETERENLIRTPTLAFFGQKEWQREKSQRERQAFFISRCENIRIRPHPWKHAVPRTQVYADEVKNFVEDVRSNKSKPLRLANI
ncbi:hypothetical protein NA57DRAFT_73908 [Rhizodiscina lignyota]|uniref:Serine hydrolase domain-containing protein n=1 Tax=Rhizodiscina lignyota TaxID=1504668 RepID=A0A9P4IJ88_9PEZI|nr:hypothetical protein NA57DRAFT_73908 [Rhizodiscina lignyota]